MDIISKKLANGRFYAYSKEHFWFWDEGHGVWKESRLMTQKYELNREVNKLLTPEDFLTDPMFFANQAAVQLPTVMLDALKDAQPGVSNPVVLTETMPEAPEAAEVTAPGFDYSGLDSPTIDTLHMAEKQYTQGKKMAETGLRWMVNAVAMAHDALCGGVVQLLDNSKHGNRGDDSFRAWCSSISLSKSSAYNLLRVAERFGNIELDGKSILDVQPATLLYEAAKPSAPEEMVQKVTTGEITSSAEYRAILKENQQLRTDRVNAMNRADQAEKRAHAAETREEEAWKLTEKVKAERDKAEAHARDVENQLEGSRKVVEAARLRGDKLKAEVDSLKSQPITAVVDEEEVERRAHQQAYGIAADITDELRTKNNQLGQEKAALLRQLEEARAANSYDPEADFDTVCSCIRSIMDFWAMAFPAYERLTGKAYRNASDYADEAANNILRDMARVDSERAQKEAKA